MKTAQWKRAAQAKYPDARPYWTPQVFPDGTPTPQYLAYHSKADWLGFGGAAGGGKSSMLLGLAGTNHRNSIIFRREFPQLRGMIEESRKIFNAEAVSHADVSFNESLHIWRLHHNNVDRIIEFGAMQHEKDKYDRQGIPHDFFGFDEAAQFSESMVRFVTGWNRTTIIGQRCRVVLAFNPPFDESGDWITKMFSPWLAALAPDVFQHHNPAQPGELRWYAMVDSKEIECDAAPFPHKGETVTPKSRTFIPAVLSDNPILAATGYGATIDAMAEPFRSLMRGNWSAKRAVNAMQVIRAANVRAAMARWTPTPPMHQTVIGADLARGGADRTLIGKWHGSWLAPLVKIPGIDTPDGPSAAARIVQEIEPEARPIIGIDIIGIGGAVYDALRNLSVSPIPVNFGSLSDLRDKSGRLSFRNVRAAAYWLFREALEDPACDIALPPDDELLADLCSVMIKNYDGGKVLLEKKDEVKARLGRSPDCADAVVIGWYIMRHSQVMVAFG